MNDLLTIHLKSLAEQHGLSGISKPKHPLFSIVRFEDLIMTDTTERVRLISDFYQIILKYNCPCKTKYGQTEYDFDEGLMSFFAPKQSHVIEPGAWQPVSGFLLLIHPNYLNGFSVQNKIKGYGFFDYNADEALILSEEEELSIKNIFQQIEKEYLLPIDTYSQDVVIANVELLLAYCNRYYNRQFITRKSVNRQLLSEVSRLLEDYFEKHASSQGLPTAHFLSEQLHLSSKYLSDCLKQLTGQTAQQIIHEKLIAKVKELLSSTELSVSEIAYALGFEFPQSLNKLFKNKTKLTPLEFRASFN